MPIDAINLAELAGLDLTGVEEVRFGEKLPEGLFVFEIIEPALEDDHVEVDGAKIQRLKAKFPLTVKDILELKDPSISQEAREKLIGKQHTHTITRKMEKDEDLPTFIGLIKGFLVDVGCQGSGQLGVLMKQANSHKFKAPIKYGNNKNDPDNPYVNLKLDKAVAITA